MKFLLLSFSVFLLLIQTPFLFAQDTLKHCGTDEFMKSVYENNPKAVFNHQLLEQFTQQFQQSGNTRQVYVIPIVFHIIHNYGYENISDWQVKDAVRILNEDFNKQNADTIEIVNQFKPIAAICGVEFRLATIAPDGSCTNGIEHIQSSTTYSGGEQSKLNPWPNENYLNIWVVREIASGAAGYTYYPGSADPDKDGIIILSSYVGSIGTGDYNRARALTHEIGHWINLKHTWGSTNSPGVACGDDSVNDTPETEGWTSCNLNGSICNGVIENVQNYMEYAYCSRMFSEGQKVRMLAALNSSISGRNNLWSSSNLIATGTANPALQIMCTPIADFISSSINICVGDQITLTDKSWNGKVLYRYWDVPGGIASSIADSVTTVTYNTTGFYSVKLHAGNNTGSNFIERTSYINVLSDTAKYYSGFSENFENGVFPSPDFVPDYSGEIDWFLKTTVGYSGNHCLAFNNFFATTGRIYGVIGPTIDVTSLTNKKLTFHVAYSQKTVDDNDRLRVLVSENCGKTWIPRYGKSGSFLATTSLHQNNFVPNSSEWRMETVYLTPNANSTNLRIKFDFQSEGGNNVYIDDINIGGYSATDNLLNENSIQIYPNPASDKLTILFNLPSAIDGSIKLYDLTGRMVYEIYSGKILSNYNYTYDLKNLSPQVYFIQLESNGFKQLYRFVKI